MIAIDASFLEGKSADEVYLILYVMTHADDNGDLVISYRNLAKEANISVKRVRTIIDKYSNKGAHLWAHQRAHLGAQSTTLLSFYDIDDYKVVKSKRGTAKGTVRGTAKGTPQPEENLLNIKKETIDLNKLTAFFNERVQGTMIPTINGIFDKRKESVRARVLTYGKQAVFNVINNAVESDFLSGRSSDFHATFDWLFGVKNFQKVLDGNYKNERSDLNRGLGKAGSSQRLSELENAISAIENG